MDEKALIQFFDARTLANAARGDACAIEAMLNMQARQGVSNMPLARLLCDHFIESDTRLDDAGRVALVQVLLHDDFVGVAGEDINRLDAILRNVDLKAQFDQFDKVLKTHLYPQILDLRDFQKAQRDWDTLSTHKALAYGNMLAGRFCAITGIERAKVFAFDEPVDVKTLGECLVQADGSSRIYVNTDRRAALSDFENYNVTLYHELEHAGQLYFVHAMRTGQMQRIRPTLRNAAVLMCAMTNRSVFQKSMEMRDG